MTEPIQTQLLNAYDLDNLFQPSRCAVDQRLFLHYLIVQGNQAKVIQWLGKISSGNLSWTQEVYRQGGNPFDFRDEVTGLTPLQLSAIKGDAFVSRMLLENNASMTATDSKGWTPYDHAFVGRKVDVLSILTERGYDPSIGKSRALSSLMNYSRPSDEATVFSYQNSSDGQIKPGTAGQFREMTGADFTSTFMATPERLVLDHMATPVTFRDVKFQALSEYLKQRYLSGYQCPELYLTPSGTIENPTAAGYGVRTAQELQPLDILFPYLGEQQVAPDHDKSNYIFGNTDAKMHRGWAGMCQDGLPNILFVTLYDVEELGEVQLAVAARKIMPGEELTWDYGNQLQTKWGRHIEFKREELENLFHTTSICEFYAQCTEREMQLRQIDWAHPTEDDLRSYLNHLLQLGILTYLFNTPGALADLILRDIVSGTEVLALCQNPTFQTYLKYAQRSVHFNDLEKLITGLLEIKSKLAQHPSSQDVETLKQTLLRTLNEKAVSTLLNLVNVMRDGQPSEWLTTMGQVLAQVDFSEKISDLLRELTDENAEKTYAEIQKHTNNAPTDLVQSLLMQYILIYRNQLSRPDIASELLKILLSFCRSVHIE